MKALCASRIVLAMALMLPCGGQLLAQDSRVPGGDESVPLGAEERNGKLVFSSTDGDFQWWFDSRIQIDGAIYNENLNPISNGTVFRRLTFAMKATLWRNWQAEVDVDFGENVLDLRDMWARYTFPKVNLSLQAGNFKEPFGMERLNSSRLLTFLERSTVTNAMALGRRIGFMGRTWTDYGQFSLGVFGHEAGTKIDKGTRDEGYSTNARLTFAPINRHGENLHIGLSGSYKTPEVTSELPANTIEIATRTETYVDDLKRLHTGDITDVNYYLRYGAELMGIYGPFYFQSEYLATQVNRWYGKSVVSLGGAYATVAWTITGETRYYYVDEGEVGPVEEPKNEWGALELAARYSVLDLSDEDIRGGVGKQWMFGLNYYPNLNFKIQFNYSLVDLSDDATSKGRIVGGDNYSFVQMRIQASL